MNQRIYVHFERLTAVTVGYTDGWAEIRQSAKWLAA